MSKNKKAHSEFFITIPRHRDERLKEYIGRVDEVFKVVRDLPGVNYTYTFYNDAENPVFVHTIYFENESDLLMAKLSI